MTEEASPAKAPWPIALAVGVAVFMVVLDTTVANVSLPYIAGNLGATIDESTWILTSFIVANAIILPLAGYMSAIFGRKNFYMASVVIFTVASVLCGLSPTLGWLIFFRILQGLGGGALQPVSQAILVEAFPEESRGMAMALMGVSAVFAPAIGPVLGGWITDNYSWHWIFFINLPMGILSFILVARMIHDPPDFKRIVRGSGVRFDYIGIGLITLALGALEIALDEGQRRDWFSSDLIVACTVIGVIALISVIFYELRQENPVIDLRLLKDRNFAVATLLLYVLGFVLFGCLSLLPIFLQTLLGYTAIQTGLVLSPGGFAILVMMPIVAIIMKWVDHRLIIAVGYFFCAAGLFWMASFNLQIDYQTAMLARLLQSFGLAFLFVPINVMAFRNVPPDKTGYASGFLNLVRNYGGSTGIALVTTMLSRRTQLHQVNLVGHISYVNPIYREFMARGNGLMIAHGASSADAAHKVPALAYHMVMRQAGMLSFADVFWMMGVLSLASIPLLLLIQNSAPQKAASSPAPMIVD
ncbi:MAG: DHA2 family efflux MFS transporter permease subunit [Candidatus Riflebacteria bacterium]|nr:DHA2 family efflux MFS transporter permease subunit [Candidatus Riflebacteria bacterium]